MKLKTLCCIAMITTILSCNREVSLEDITKTDDFITVLGVAADEQGAVVKMPDGNYLAYYNVNVNSTQQDIGIAIINPDGTLKSQNTFGGTGQEEVIGNPNFDAAGNIYVIGRTRSRELRMDKYIDLTNGTAGYIAKLDPNGNFLWHRGFSDTTAPFEGAYDEKFTNVFIINNKIYCYGDSHNYFPKDGKTRMPQGVLTVFDMDGKWLQTRRIDNRELANWSGITTSFGLQFPNNDLLFVSGVLELFSTNRAFDTSLIMTRYNPITDQIVWQRGYPIGGPEGDGFWVAIDNSGNITGATTTFSHFISYNGANGDVLVSQSMESDSNAAVFIPSDIKETSDGFVFFGGVDDGVAYNYANNGGNPTFHNSTPNIVAVTKEGKIKYRRSYPELPKAFFTGGIPKENGDLIMVGGIYKYESRHRDLFMLSLTSNGDIIRPK